MSSDQIKNRCICIFDSPRLRSHLFFRWLSTHQNVYPIYHPYLMPAMFGSDPVAQHLKHSEMRQQEIDTERTRLSKPEYTFENATRQAEEAVTVAKSKNQIPAMNEHWFNILKLELVLDLTRDKISTPEAFGSNPTYLPDAIFNSISPIILIRHPALTVNSIYRTALQHTKQRPGDEDFDFIVTNNPLRLLFDYFKAQNRQPVVIDGEDILWRTEEVGSKLCEVLRLESGSLSDTWEQTSKEEIERMNPLVYALTKTIQESREIERPEMRPQEPDLELQCKEWRDVYGDEVAEKLYRLAKDNMENYEYLASFKI